MPGRGGRLAAVDAGRVGGRRPAARRRRTSSSRSRTRAPAPVDLAGLEVVYATSTGSTVTRKGTWASSHVLDPGRRTLLVNARGRLRGIGDVAYTGGFAATGGAVALRVVGGAVVDAVGWGDATNGFVEGLVAAAPPAGSSLERRPGGPAGNGIDTNDNATDFVVQRNARPAGAVGAARAGVADADAHPDRWRRHRRRPRVPTPTAVPSTDADPDAFAHADRRAEPDADRGAHRDADADTDATPTPTPTASPSPAPTPTPTPTADADADPITTIAGARRCPTHARDRRRRPDDRAGRARESAGRRSSRTPPAGIAHLPRAPVVGPLPAGTESAPTGTPR